MQVWRDSWWEAERLTALAALDDLLDSVDAWAPAVSAWGLGTEDPLLPAYAATAPVASATPAYQVLPPLPKQDTLVSPVIP